jgi:hypothetical protein
MVSRREVIVKSADEYRKASKKDKGQILVPVTVKSATDPGSNRPRSR